MSESSNQMKLINSEFRNASAETDKYGNAMDKTGAKKKQLNGLIDQQRIRIQAIKNEQKHWTEELRKGNITEEQHAQKQQELARRLNNTEAEMKKYQGQLKRLNSEGKVAVKTYADFDRQFRNVGRTMRSVGAQVGITAGVGFIAMKRVLGDVVNEAMGFEHQMAEVKAISGATGEQMEVLTGQSKDLGRQTIFTSEQVAEAQAGLARAGFEVNEITSAMPGLLDLAASSNMELGRASDITANILRGFNKEASESGRVADILAKGASTANTDVEGLGASMEVVAPVAATLGVEFEEVAAATGKMADSGIEGSKAGRMLRQGMLRLSKPTGEAADLIDELGINVFDADGNMKSLDKVVGELEKGLKGQSKQAKAAAMATIFGSESTAGWSVLLEEGSDALKTYSDDLADSEGAAADMAETMQDTAQGAITRMQSALSGLKIELGEKLLPILSDGADLVSDFADKLQSMDDATVETIAETALLVTALLGVTTALAGLVTGIGALMAFAGPVGLAIVGGTALLGGLAIAIRTNQKRTKQLAEEQQQAHEDALAYGAGLSEGTKKGVQGYKDLLDEARVKMSELKNMSGEEAQKTVKEINAAFAELGDMVAAELEDQKDKLTTAITQVFEVAGETGRKEAEEINKKVIDVINDKIDAHGKAIETIIDIQEEYGTSTADMPREIRESYLEALEAVDEGMKNFAASQEEMDAITLAVSENKGKISNKIAQDHLKSLNESYAESTRSAQEWRNDMIDELEQGLAQGHISQEEFDKAMLNTEAKTNQMLAKAADKRNDALQELSKHLDDRGILLDLATGEELERRQVYDETILGMNKMREENDEEYLQRWLEMNQETLNSTEEYSKATRDNYKQFLEEYLISAGESKEEAARIAEELVKESLDEFDKGEEEARESGKKKSKAHKEGIESQLEGNKQSSREVSDSSNQELGKGKDKAKGHGKGKGQAHKEGLDSTKGNNKNSSFSIVETSLFELAKGKTQSQNAGKEKGRAHEYGLYNTLRGNEKTGRKVSQTVTSELKSTTDGGGGRNAGELFRRGLASVKGSARTAGVSVARSGKKGLGSVSTRSAGSNFVAGFRSSIYSGRGSVGTAAASLASRALSSLKNTLKTASPSKETEKIGMFFTQGFQGGIEDEEKKAINQAIQLAKNTYGALENELDVFRHSFDAIGLSIKENKQSLIVEHTLDNRFNEMIMAVNKKNDTTIQEKMLNAMFEQIELLMKLVMKDPNVYLDSRQLSDGLFPHLQRKGEREKIAKARAQGRQI